MNIYVYIHKYLQTHTLKHVLTTCKSVNTHERTRALTHADTHVRKNTHTQALYIHTRKHIIPHTHTHICTLNQIYIYIHMCTYLDT